MLVAKRKPGAGRKKGPLPPRSLIAAVKGSAAFETWFAELLEYCRRESGWSTLPASSVIERALVAFAKTEGFEKEAPAR